MFSSICMFRDIHDGAHDNHNTSLILHLPSIDSGLVEFTNIDFCIHILKDYVHEDRFLHPPLPSPLQPPSPPPPPPRQSIHKKLYLYQNAVSFQSCIIAHNSFNTCHYKRTGATGWQSLWT